MPAPSRSDAGTAFAAYRHRSSADPVTGLHGRTLSESTVDCDAAAAGVDSCSKPADGNGLAKVNMRSGCDDVALDVASACVRSGLFVMAALHPVGQHGWRPIGDRGGANGRGLAAARSGGIGGVAKRVELTSRPRTTARCCDNEKRANEVQRRGSRGRRTRG